MGSSSTIARRFGLLLALTVTVGFISSFISRGNCEAHAAGEIAQGLRASLGVPDRMVYVLPDDGDPAVWYGFVAAPLSGHGSRMVYCAFFGLVFPVHGRGGWVTYLRPPGTNDQRQ